MLDILHQIFTNNYKYDIVSVLELQNVLQIRSAWFNDTEFWCEASEFHQHVDTYHEKNIEFITNLEKMFGTNITFKIFDASFYYRWCNLPFCDIWTSNLACNSIINKQIDLDEYKNMTDMTRPIS